MVDTGDLLHLREALSEGLILEIGENKIVDVLAKRLLLVLASRVASVGHLRPAVTVYMCSCTAVPVWVVARVGVGFTSPPSPPTHTTPILSHTHPLVCHTINNTQLFAV